MQPRGPFLSNQIASLLSAPQDKSSSKPILNETAAESKDPFMDRPAGQGPVGQRSTHVRPDHNTLKTFTPRNGAHTSSNPALNKFPLECSGTTNIMNNERDEVTANLRPTIATHALLLSTEIDNGRAGLRNTEGGMQSFGGSNQNGSGHAVASSFNDDKTTCRPVVKNISNNINTKKCNPIEESASASSKFV